MGLKTKITAIIMAGGKSSRFRFDELNLNIKEKTLLPFRNDFLIDSVLKAVLKVKKISTIILAISPNTPETKTYCKKNYKSIEIIDTPGSDYHSDLRFIIKKFRLGIVISIVADIPLISSKILSNIIRKYFFLKSPALSVVSNINFFKENNLSLSSRINSNDSHQNLIPLGINIIDGNLIDLPYIDEVKYKLKKQELLFNINTINDYNQLKKLF